MQKGLGKKVAKSKVAAKKWLYIRSVSKILITIEVNLLLIPNEAGMRQHTSIVALKFSNNLPSQPFIDCHFGFQLHFFIGPHPFLYKLAVFEWINTIYFFGNIKAIP